jgi:pyruvate dehydrogenase E2 component (dihydrolipoamide acetyltransferase)
LLGGKRLAGLVQGDFGVGFGVCWRRNRGEQTDDDGDQAISPRARNLAERKGMETSAVAGSGPGGRIIERDVEAALASMPKLTPVAKAMVSSGEFETASVGTGPGGRVMSRDLTPKGVPIAAGSSSTHVTQQAAGSTQPLDEVQSTPVRGIRAVIASRMLDSLQTTAQLTLNASADARAILAYRKRLKASPDALGLQRVTINDLVLLAVSRTLTQYPEMNALYDGEMLHQYSNVHLGVAVDTPRGLMVPTVRYANTLTLRDLAAETKRVAVACVESRITPDELTGGTFTVTNLGAFGVESFTPVLNPPQVGILGVGNINLKPVQVDGEVEFIPHIGLSLTINHQVVDGAPAARFLQTLAQGIGEVELLMAM